MNAFIDTSVMIKVYLEEAGSLQARDLFRSSDVVVSSVLLYPEMHATFARKARAGADPERLKTARESFEIDWPSFLVVSIDQPLLAICRQLLERHPLRAADAIHLASAVESRSVLQAPARFASADLTLAEAAQREGFDVVTTLS